MQSFSLPTKRMSSVDEVLKGLCVAVYVCVINKCGDGGRTAHTAGFSIPSRRAGLDRAEGAGGRWRGAALLVPQDGVLVVELQLLHRSAAGLLSATVPSFHHLKGLLHFSVLACLHMFGCGL